MRRVARGGRPVALCAVAAIVAVVPVAGGRTNETIALRGLRLTVPPGWDRESFVNPSGLSVVRVGTFAFPHATHDDVGQIARGSMGADDVLINVVDFTAVDPGDRLSAYTPLTAPLTVEASGAIPQEGYTVPAVIRSVRVDGHNLYVSVAFGTAPPSPAQVAAANAVLRTLAAGG